MCDKVDHLAKDYPFSVFNTTLILVVRGRGSTRGASDRCSGARVGGRGATQLVDSRG